MTELRKPQTPFMPEIPVKGAVLSYDIMVDSWRKGIQDIVGYLFKKIETLDDISDGDTYGRVLTTSITAGQIILTETIGNLDDIDDGDPSTGYGRILMTKINAGSILLSETVGNLDDIDDGDDYGKVLSTNITAGSILLSECVNSTEILGNLVIDPGFESQDAFWTTGGAQDFTFENGNPYRGTYAAEQDGSSDGWLSSTKSFITAEGERYSIGAWAAADSGADGEFWIYAQFREADGTYISNEKLTDTSMPGTSYEWRRGTITAPASAAYGRIAVARQGSPTTGTLYVDQVTCSNIPKSLDDVEDGTNYKRTATAALSAGGLVLLDEVVEGDYGLVDATYISAGKIVLAGGIVGDADDIDASATRKWAGEAGAVKNFSSLTDDGGTLTISSSKLVLSTADGIQVENSGDIIFRDSTPAIIGRLATYGVGAVELSATTGNTLYLTGGSVNMLAHTADLTIGTMLAGDDVVIKTGDTTRIKIFDSVPEIKCYCAIDAGSQNLIIDTINATGKIDTSGEVECGSLDVNGNADISGTFYAGATITPNANATIGDTTNYVGYLHCARYYAVFGASSYAGANGTFTDNDGNTVRVRAGIITDLTE